MTAARMDHMQGVIDALRQSLTEMTIEVVNFRAAVTSNIGTMANLNATANAASDAQAKRMDDLENGLQEVQGQTQETHVRR